MKKIEKRSVFCLVLALALAVGLGVFVVLFFLNGGRWVSFAANRHLYNSAGQLKVGRVLDRDGDVLSWVEENGTRTYYNSATVRRATLHAVGDAQGKIGTGALTAFADLLSGYNPLTGAYSPLGEGNDLYLTLDARLNYEAYQALNGRKGAVGVYNYKTGEILCMVSTPTYDPLNVPEDLETSEEYEGAYLNRFLSSAYVPGSVFKTVTLQAAIETLPDLFERTWTCTGSVSVGGETITCPRAHGELDIAGAYANSCNGVFGQLAAELGGDTLERYAGQAGLTPSYSVNGIDTAPGRVDLSSASGGQVAWAGVGQYTDTLNPCALMVYMGAIANGGTAAVPQLVLRTENALGMESGYHSRSTGRLVSASTAETLAELMANNVAETYGTGRFPNMDLCAKTGTGEVGGGEQPNAWFAGFLRNEDAPYAFVVVVENGGSGNDVAGSIAARVLDALVNGY